MRIGEFEELSRGDRAREFEEFLREMKGCDPERSRTRKMMKTGEAKVLASMLGECLEAAAEAGAMVMVMAIAMKRSKSSRAGDGKGVS